MPYLTATELNSSLYPEIQAAISRGQTTTVELHINEALTYVQSRLSVKYDMEAEFAKTGAARNNLLLKFTKDIAIYYLYDLPETIPDKRTKAYNDAVAFFDDVGRGRTILAGIPPAPENSESANAGTVSFGSEEKRYNRLN